MQYVIAATEADAQRFFEAQAHTFIHRRTLFIQQRISVICVYLILTRISPAI